MTRLCCDTRAISERYGLAQWTLPGLDGRIGRRVLGRLGLDVDLPPLRVAVAYETFLPEGRGIGYWRLLRDALDLSRCFSWNPQRELDWLAARIRIAAPDERLPSWERRWHRAEEIGGLRGRSPGSLGALSRRRLVEDLATPSGYHDLVADALAVAMTIELA